MEKKIKILHFELDDKPGGIESFIYNLYVGIDKTKFDFDIISRKYDVMTIDAVHTYEEIQQLRRPTNFYSKEELEQAVKKPAIIHYTINMLVVRPWFSNTDHPFVGEFRKYMDMSAWKNRELKEMVFDSKVAKVIKTIMILPKSIAYSALGLIHAELKPKYIRMRAGK